MSWCCDVDGVGGGWVVFVDVGVMFGGVENYCCWFVDFKKVFEGWLVEDVEFGDVVWW